MGLDMYAYSVPVELVGDQQVDFRGQLFREGRPLDGVDASFFYWRKFNHLHGWMEQLYYKKGGKSLEFNGDTVRLLPEDINVLESLASLKALPPKKGFFFGPYELFDDEDKTNVLNFVHKSRDAFADGKAVIYDSWW